MLHQWDVGYLQVACSFRAKKIGIRNGNWPCRLPNYSLSSVQVSYGREHWQGKIGTFWSGMHDSDGWTSDPTAPPLPAEATPSLCLIRLIFALQQNTCSWCSHWEPSLLTTYSRVRFQHVPWRGTKSDPETADFCTKIIVICILIFIARNLRTICGKDTRSERKEDNLRLGQTDQYGF